MGNNNKAPMMQPIPLAQPQGPQPPQNAQTMPGQTFGQPTGGVPGYAQPGQPKPKKPIWKQWWFWVIIVVVVVLDIAIIGGAGNSQGGGSAVDSSSAQSVAPKSTQKATPKKDAKLTGITASYSGSIKDGEQVTDKTSGITVTAKYDDGTTKNVTGWKIQFPAPPPIRLGGNKPLCLAGVGLSGFSYSHGFPRILTFSRDNVGKMWAKIEPRTGWLRGFCIVLRVSARWTGPV